MYKMVEVVDGGIVRKKLSSNSGEHRLIAEISDKAEVNVLDEVIAALNTEHRISMEDGASSAYLCGLVRAIQILQKMRDV